MRRGTRVRIAAAVVGTKGRRLAAVLSVAVFAGMTMAPVTGTAASWQDQEWASQQVGTVDCAALTDAASTGHGTVLSGSVLATDLDDIAEVSGVTATAESGTTTATPASADPATDPQGDPGTAWADALSATVLQGLSADLTDVLVFDTGNGTGAYGQYAVARDDASSGGAAGLVTDAGGIALDPGPGGQYPGFATVSIGTLLGAAGGGALSDAVTGITDAALEIGALAVSATLDACDAAWSGTHANLDRDYFIAGLDATVTSPAVAAVGTAVADAVTTVAGDVAGLGGVTGALAGVLNGILGTQLSVPGVLGLGTPHVTALTLVADLSPVTDLLGEIPLGTGGELGSIDVSAGTVRLDLAELLGPAFGPSDGLNGLAPNTELLINAAQMNRISAAVTDALGGFADEITDAFTTALDSVDVTLKLSVPVSVDVAVGSVGVGSVDVTIANLLGNPTDTDTENDPDITAVFSRAECTLGVVLCATVDGLVSTLLGNGLVSSVIDGVANLVPTLATTVTDTIDAATGPTLTDLTADLTDPGGLIATAASAVGTGFGGLFGPDGLLSLTINNQNAPDPADAVAGNLEPAWASDLLPPQTSPFRSGRFDVSALRIVGAGALAGGIATDLARAGVGSNSLA